MNKSDTLSFWGGLAAVFASLIFWLAAQQTADTIVANFALTVLIVVLLVALVKQPCLEDRVTLLAMASLILPMVSLPQSKIVGVIGDVLGLIQLPTDRVQIVMVLIVISAWVVFLNCIFRTIRNYPGMTGLGVLYVASVVFVALSHDFTFRSVWQCIFDISLIVGCVATVLYFRTLYRPLEDKLFLKINFAMKLFGAVLVIDVGLSLVGAVEWSRSYRNGIQGALYGMEVPFSFVLGVVAVWICSRIYSQRKRWLIFLVFAPFLVLTNVTSAYAAAAISVLSRDVLLGRGFFKAIFSIFIIALLFLTISNFNSILAAESSWWVRVGTLVVGLGVLVDGKLYLGVMPGVFDFTAVSNLALEIFDTGYSDLLGGFGDNVSGELLERQGYEEGGAFLPHVASVALIAAYGLVIIPPVFYYTFYLPGKLFFNRELVKDKDLWSWSRVFIFSIIFSFNHPFLLPILVVFLGEIIRLKIR